MAQPWAWDGQTDLHHYSWRLFHLCSFANVSVSEVKDWVTSWAPCSFMGRGLSQEGPCRCCRDGMFVPLRLDTVWQGQKCFPLFSSCQIHLCPGRTCLSLGIFWGLLQPCSLCLSSFYVAFDPSSQGQKEHLFKMNRMSFPNTLQTPREPCLVVFMYKLIINAIQVS